MEVHAHTHPASGGPEASGRKKFTHYLWEFLMLFLAVFCGFLAENFRENLVERHRETEYMHTLVEDLQTDTLNLNDAIPYGREISDRIGKLISLLNNDPLPKDSIENLYLLNQKASRVVKIHFEDRTSSQLKNAGNMRLVRNKEVADSIRYYWSIIKTTDEISDRLENMRSKERDVGVQLFYARYIKYLNMQDPLQSDFSVLPGAKLINDDPKLMAEYANWWQVIQLVLNNYLVHLSDAKNAAQNLIAFIKKNIS